MKPLHKFTGLLALFPLMIACQKNPDPVLQAPLTVASLVTQNSEGLKVDFNPQVDIVFLIDNSRSMQKHQQNVSTNLTSFVNALVRDTGTQGQLDEMDMHIGAVSVYDSVTYQGLTVSELKPDQGFYPMGYLRPLRDAKGQVLASELPYVTRSTPDFANVLKSTLLIGALDLNRAEPLNSGPEFEEIFSPIVSLLSGEDRPLLPQQGSFIRPGAHFVAILVTDAPDSSRFTASQLDEFIRLTRNDPNRETFTLFSIIPHRGLATRDEAKKNGCPYDPAGEPANIVELMRITGGHSFDLCKGDEMSRTLAEMGELIRKRTIKRRITLGHDNGIPEVSTIHVTYDDKAVPSDPEDGWMYDPNEVALTVYGLGDNKIREGAELKITYRPVPMRNMQRGTARPLSL